MVVSVRKKRCSNEGNASIALPASFSNVNNEYMLKHNPTNVYNYVVNDECIPTNTRLTRSQRNKIVGTIIF